MRLLSASSVLLVGLTITMSVATVAVQTRAHPDEPDHGLNESTDAGLWSGDDDSVNVSGGVALAEIDSRNASQSAMATLAAGTDIPFDSPPQVVEHWNRADLGDFPETGSRTAVHPPSATLRDGVLVRDAHASIVAIQPSTRARISPDEHPLFVRSNGTVLGAIDYRVAVPADTESGNRTTTRELARHRVVETRLLVDGTVETIGDGTKTPVLSYDDLESYVGRTHTVTLEADIRVGLRVETTDCVERAANGTCLAGETSVRYPGETITVRDSITVAVYDLGVSGFRARYPDGDLGIVMFKSRPWLGYTFPGGQVRGVWRFYTAQDDDWSQLIRSTADDETTIHSPVHPLQVHAFPIETGPTTHPRDTVSILSVYGDRTRPPTLPANISLDVLDEPYTASYGIATRIEGDVTLEEVQAQGLVRGESATPRASSFADVPIHRSNLTISVLERTETNVTVEVTLLDRQTGEPIATDERQGYVVLAGERVNTSAGGTVQRTISQGGGSIAARYEPGQWWNALTGYVGDSDVVYVRGTVIDALSTAYRIGVPVSLFLFAVFIIDRFTGWALWPPWRGL